MQLRRFASQLPLQALIAAASSRALMCAIGQEMSARNIITVARAVAAKMTQKQARVSLPNL